MMVIHGFPPVECADRDGLIAIGGDLEVNSLLLAYSSGIFPWPISPHMPIPWFAPPVRSVLFFKDLHISHSLKKILRKCPFHFTLDRDFQAVITNCAKTDNRKGQHSTWITDQIIKAYIDLHRAGYAHSLECRALDGQLVGGIYGVSIGGMFAGESMFCLQSSASKCALVKLIEILSKRGATWIDCQVENSLSLSFGAKSIPRADFQRLLASTLPKSPLFP